MYQAMRNSLVLFFPMNIFLKKKKLVKYGAFRPPHNSLDLSVFLISGLSESEVWGIGRKHVQGPRRLKARADFIAKFAYENNLKVILDCEGHERHASVTPIPLDRRVRDRIARKLALASLLVIMPTE